MSVFNFRSWAASAAAFAAILLAGCGGGGDSGTAIVRVVNATLSHPSVNLLVSASVAASGAAVDTVSSYVGVPSGSPMLQVNDTASGTALASTTPSLSGDQRYALVVYENAGIVRTAVIGEDTAAPAAGSASLRVFDTALDAGALDVYVTAPGIDLATVTSPTFSVNAATTVQASNFSSFAPGNYQIRVTGAGNRSDLRLDIASTALTSQQIVTVLLTPTVGGTLVNGGVLLQQDTYTPARNTSIRLRLAAAVTTGASVSATAGSTSIAALTAPSVGSYATVPAGAAVSIAVNGTNVAAPALALAAGSDATLLVYGNAATPVASYVLDDNHLPASNSTLKLRLLNGLTGAASPLTLTANFAVVASNIAPAAVSSYAVVGATPTLRLDVTTPGNPTSIFPGGAALTVPGNAVYTLFMLGDASAPVPLLRRDR